MTGARRPFPLVKDKLENRYKRSMDQAYKASV